MKMGRVGTMKNIINYYYNLKIEDIKQRENVIYFFVSNFKYVFIPYTKELQLAQSIYELNQILIQRNIFTHQIMLNINGQILTYVNGEYYILLKIIYPNNKIQMPDILYLNNIQLNSPDNLKRNNWAKMWSEKNDYLEYQVSQLGKKHPDIRFSFAYYLGLAETSIALVNELNLVSTKLYLSHVRINDSDTYYELLDPLNLILDYKVRDIAEYFKSSFFSGKDINDELNNYLFQTMLTYEEWILFFARMLYPSYYFDLHEEIINGRKDNSDLKKMTSKVNEFEKILVDIYFKIRSFPNTPIIDYFENKKNIN